MKKQREKYDIFISYRRNGGEFTAKILRDRLEKQGYRVFFDVETLRSGDFNTRLYSVIDECTDFLLVLSPGALDRCVNEGDWVRYEVERALLKQKNIIPVMLRGFTFPDVLPESIDPIRYKSGLEANSQFFDAFMQTLREYLKSEPVKRRFPTALAIGAAAALAVGVGLFFLVRSNRAVFPRTKTEKSVTDEVVYYVQSNLTYLDEMFSAADGAMDAARRYLTTGSGSFSGLEASFEVALDRLENCQVDNCAPSDGLLQRVGELTDMPFSPADLIGMHDTVVTTQTEWMGNLSFLLWAADPDSFLSGDTRLADLEYLQGFLEEEAKLHAYNVNELLLPVTDMSALDEFFNDYLPTLRRIPLASSSWSREKEALTADQERSINRQEELVMEYSALTGNMTMDTAAMRESLIRTYETMGLSRAEAEALVEQWLVLTGQTVGNQ